ncbi:glucose-1-phosphate cytidylyltransferase [Candidatus Magnetobacterium bavaricum]|uniref:Glucose-1-phosphate cytidylyltransferase n=1 Tax=Candidatus Magnetobacterium bavaricum TaxID=29290 RepID=A0A0F3GHB4_9BACT|nr:glucose-1-phosphate cytidylyltransferase [Candidatus Magnetobacterium bavaricum]
MKVVILCGGHGTRLREETELKPKPMIEIGDMPILWHIMKRYAYYGYNDFILCLGYKANVIKDYFYNYEIKVNDFTIELGSKKIDIHLKHSETGWRITLVDTGVDTMTGARIKRVGRFIDSDEFMLTYGDGVTDLNIDELLHFHRKHGKIGTVTGVTPPSRYGELLIKDNQVISFQEKPSTNNNTISGGYFVFKREFLDYLDDNENCVMEKAPLEKLVSTGNLAVFQHKGFWQCMDTYRDYKYLTWLYNEGKPPWKVW